MRPIAACAMSVVERTRVSQVTPESPGTPRAVVYSLYRALPGERLFCHRRLARLLARLDTSTAMSGPHDFAVRLKRFRQRRHPRPPLPAPALMTLRNAPPSGTGWQIIQLIFISEKQKYFCQRGWTRHNQAAHGGEVICPSGKIRC